MSKSRDTIKLKNSDTVRLGSDDTLRLDETVKLSDQTQKISGNVIKSGFGGSIVLGQTKDNLYKFNNTQYRVISKISDSTSEAQIFLIERDANQFVLKYYYPFVKPKMDLIKKIRKFKHPDIISVIDYGYFEERFFEILEYADQGSLIQQIPINNLKLIKKYIGEINEGLNYCHENGIIHRDIKPSNIFLKSEKRKDVLLGDFGIASLIDKGEQFRRTNIFQTPIYAAPEYRMNLNGETIITKAVDYYALGITIWEIWTGEVPPTKMDDLEFLRLMFDGNPPLPADLNDEIAYLIRGLTQKDHKLRWGYEAVKKWINGKPLALPEVHETKYKNLFDFGIDKKGKKLSASNPQELAKLINDNPETGRKHLYRGTIKQWLKEQGAQRLFIEIADITDYKFKDDEITGTAYAVYILDRNFPYIGIDGKPYKSKKELTWILDNNISDYRELLTNPNDKFYLFLLSKNAVDEVEKYRSYFERYEKKLAIYYVIYDLRFSVEKNVPFYYANDNDGISFNSIQEIADYFFDNPDEAAKIMKLNKFPIWLNFMNAAIFQKFEAAVKKYSLKSKKLPQILPYILDPERGYEGLSGDMCYNLFDLGKEFDKYFYQYKKILKDKNAKIYTYLELKEYKGEIEYCHEVFNMKDAEWRDSYYNDNVALMKIIRGFGWTPVMYINKKINGDKVDKIANYKPEDLVANRKILGKQLIDSLNNPDSVTIAWLSIFFHEYPLNDDNSMYMYGCKDFDERLQKFMEFIKDNFPETDMAQRYSKAKNITKKLNEKFFSTDRLNKFIYFIGLALPFAAATFLLAYSYFGSGIYLPKSIWAVNIWYFILVLGPVIVYFFLSEDFDSITSSVITGAIVGLILAAVLYYLFQLIVGSPIVLFVLLTAGYYFYYKFFMEIYNTLVSFQDENNLSANKEEIDTLIVRYTFKKTDDIEVQQTESLKSNKKEIRFKILFLAGYAIGITLILAGILFLLIYHDPYL